MTQPSILVVEDDPIICELVCQLLELHEWSCQGVPDGQSAIESVRRMRPDAVVLDLMLPDIDGYEVCKAIKSDSQLQQIGVLVLTALGGEEYRRKAFESGADRFLSKPFVHDEVIRELDSIQREYRDGGKRGPRVEFVVTLGEADRPAVDRVAELISELFCSTPMAAEDIESVGKAILQVERNAQEQCGGDVKLGFQTLVFRDRLEHVIYFEGAATTETNRKTDLEQIVGLVGDVKHPLAGRLGDTFRFSGDGGRIVVTRAFA